MSTGVITHLDESMAKLRDKHLYKLLAITQPLKEDCNLLCEAVVHDGLVVVSHLAGVSQPPTVAVAVVRAVRVAAVVTHGQGRRGPDPCILVKLGRARILLKGFY